MTVFALSTAALLAAVPSAAAQDIPVLCNPEPLGTPGGGVVGDVKRFGNPVIYGACILAVNVAGDALVFVNGVLVIAEDAVNLVCVFATGQPCLPLNPL